MSRYDHKIGTSLEGIVHLSKEKKEKKERKMKEKNHYYNPLILYLPESRNEKGRTKKKKTKDSEVVQKLSKIRNS